MSPFFYIMCVELILIVCGLLEINAVVFPIVNPKVLYNYSPPEDDVTFHLYHRKHSIVCFCRIILLVVEPEWFRIKEFLNPFPEDDLSRNDIIFIGNESSVSRSRFDSELPTKIIVHGWTHGRNVPWIVEMREVLAETGLWNVIVVDWASLSHVIYAEARLHNLVVGKQLGYLLLFLKDCKDIPLSSVHLIGHSMGAHIAATAAFNVQFYIEQKVGRITGLDPAAPLYEWPHIECLDEVLDPSDAEFVDVIHTNARHLGMITPAGHVDYYPNGGELQSNCAFWVCSHIRSCEYFIASIRKPDLFKAISFKCWNEYLDGKRDHIDAYPMGIAASPDIPSGLYFVEITDEYMRYTHTRTTITDSL